MSPFATDNFLPFDDFIAGYKAGTVSIHIDPSKAMHVCDGDQRLQKSVRAAHKLWKHIGCLLPMVGIGLFFFVKWYWAILAIFLGILIMQATRKSAGHFIRDQALQNPDFYYDMVSHGVIRTSGAPS